MRNRMLLVDGFNVLRSGSRYKKLSLASPDWDHDAFNAARELLINDVASFAGSDWEAVIVFDGGGNQESTGHPQRIGNVKVIFSASGYAADSVIERLSYQARNADKEVLVVTSDASIQDAVFGLGVDRMSAEGFSQEIDRYYEEELLDHMPAVSSKRTLAERVDRTTLEKLIALRDSN